MNDILDVILKQNPSYSELKC